MTEGRPEGTGPGAREADTRAATVPAAEEIEGWLRRYVGQLVESDPATVDVSAPFERFGMDSSAAVGMAGDLEEWLGFEVDPTAPYDYPTIRALARHLAEAAAGRAADGHRAP